MILPRSLLVPAALCAVLAAPVRCADFIDSVTGQAAMKSEADAQACQKEAEQQLAAPRAGLQKKCEEAGGQFNTGLPALSLHRASCSVYQTVTCSGTGAPTASTQTRTSSDAPAAAEGDAALPPLAPLPAKKSPTRKKKAKKAPPVSRQAQN
jgi:hypothetical protein